MNQITKVTGLTLGLLMAFNAAHATNGYFSSGFGIKTEGLAGTGISLPLDSLASATNPAGLSDVSNRFDVGAELFLPKREASITGNFVAPNASYDGNGKKLFVIPAIGYSQQIRPDLTAGLALYGNGGLNTDYANNPYARFGASGSAGVDLSQLFIKPALAWKPNAANSFGVGLNFAIQRFPAKGLNAFSTFSKSPANLTDRGNDWSHGVGVHLGWQGQLTDQITLGATWQSKIKVNKFDKYQGLFADGGQFDIPQTYGIGLTFRPDQKMTLSADVQRIDYSDVNAVGNVLAALLSGVPLGADNGPGFGWRDVTAFKFGVQYRLDDTLVTRFGVSSGRQPVPANQTFFNILAPGVIENHVAFGTTWSIDKKTELSFSYTHAFNKNINGSGSIPAAFGGGEANIRLRENVLGFSYGLKL